MECEKFKMIRRPHIIITNFGDKIELEKSDDTNKPEDANRKNVTDVFKAFPDVQFTMIYNARISFKKALDIQKKYQNVNFDFVYIEEQRNSRDL